MTDAGWSTCPSCGKHWLVTPSEDCLMPLGGDTSANNPNRTCEPCGLIAAGHGDKPLPVVDLMDFPGGRRCCICFEGKLIAELEPVSDEPGKVWDVCRECAAHEKARGAAY